MRRNSRRVLATTCSIMALFAATDLAVGQTPLREIQVNPPKQAPKRTAAKPRRVVRRPAPATPAAPAPTPEQVQAQANRQVVQRTQNFDQRRDNVIMPKIGANTYELSQRDLENIPQANAIQLSDLA